jgi:hypothetical protein
MRISLRHLHFTESLAILRGEGLVIKSLNSKYILGERGDAWVKVSLQLPHHDYPSLHSCIHPRSNRSTWSVSYHVDILCC